MYTQCPQCQTVFEISADHLKAANGEVRCGQCLNVFNALNHLSEQIPAENSQPPDQPPEKVFTESERAEVFDNPPESTETTTLPHEAFEGEDVGEAVSDTTPAPVEEDHELNEFFSDVIDDSHDYTEIAFETREEKAKPLSPDGGFFYGGANEATIEKILTEHAPEERELDEFTLPSEPVSETMSDAIDDNESEEEKPGGSDIPPQLLEDLQEEHLAQKKSASNRFWLSGSIVLMLVFILQAIYFSRHDLAKNPAYRPLLTQACEMLGCSINVAYDIDLIEIIGRDVRSHPSAKHALIAGTTLINNAKFSQPYPLLTLTFSDITGTKVAQRRFTPREYLKSGTNIRAGMTPDLPVQVELELVDPGKNAVNFEFHAERDPRSLTPLKKG